MYTRRINGGLDQVHGIGMLVRCCRARKSRGRADLNPRGWARRDDIKSRVRGRGGIQASFRYPVTLTDNDISLTAFQALRHPFRPESRRPRIRRGGMSPAARRHMCEDRPSAVPKRPFDADRLLLATA